MGKLKGEQWQWCSELGWSQAHGAGPGRGALPAAPTGSRRLLLPALALFPQVACFLPGVRDP